MRRRRWNKLKAAAGGYFWKSCPTCGQMFGGHEWLTEGVNGPAHIPASAAGHAIRDGSEHVAICPDCTEAGRGWDIWQWRHWWETGKPPRPDGQPWPWQVEA